MVTPKAWARLTRSCVRLTVCREITISGGSSEMDVNELTVMPCCSPSYARGHDGHPRGPGPHRCAELFGIKCHWLFHNRVFIIKAR